MRADCIELLHAAPHLLAAGCVFVEGIIRDGRRTTALQANLPQLNGTTRRHCIEDERWILHTKNEDQGLRDAERLIEGHPALQNGQQGIVATLGLDGIPQGDFGRLFAPDLDAQRRLERCTE